jgi:hypothetical protein
MTTRANLIVAATNSRRHYTRKLEPATYHEGWYDGQALCSNPEFWGVTVLAEPSREDLQKGRGYLFRPMAELPMCKKCERLAAKLDEAAT